MKRGKTYRRDAKAMKGATPAGMISDQHGTTCCPVRTAEAIAREHDVKIDGYTLLRFLDNCAKCEHHRKRD